MWLSIDADRSENRDFRERFHSSGLPTLWVIDPTSGRVILKWERGATAGTLDALLTASREVRASEQWDEKSVANRWIASLEKSAAGAPTADARIAFDEPLCDAYLAVGAPERAIPMLERSAHDFERWYEPHYALARMYVALNRIDDAWTEIERADHRISGLWSVDVLLFEADIAKKRGDVGSERFALARALAHLAGLNFVDRAWREKRTATRARLDALP